MTQIQQPQFADYYQIKSQKGGGIGGANATNGNIRNNSTTVESRERPQTSSQPRIIGQQPKTVVSTTKKTFPLNSNSNNNNTNNSKPGHVYHQTQSSIQFNMTELAKLYIKALDMLTING